MRRGAGAITVEVSDLRVGSDDGVSFSLRAGEILGIAALEGQGQDELFARPRGQRRAEGGEINVAGKALRPRHPYDAIRSGVVLVPADRLLALLPQRPVRENIAAPRYNRIAPLGADQSARREPARRDTRSKPCRSTRARSDRCAGSPAATSRR